MASKIVPLLSQTLDAESAKKRGTFRGARSSFGRLVSDAFSPWCRCWKFSCQHGSTIPPPLFGTLLERRWGRRISKRGHHRDPLASSRKRSVSTSGLRWIVLTLVVTPPWTTRCWALPILSVPAPTPKVSERLGLRHKTIAQWARQMIRVVRRWLPQVAITVLGDQSYSVVELAHACRRCGVRLIAPLRLDAVLHEAPPPRQPGTWGRPRLKGRGSAKKQGAFKQNRVQR